jgi:NAD(P)H-hydrate repair Nnr-like enzyme with NAD(P)H-hydrate dehydratase domain/NAD(P)H-hydrate repair Nnr-like enzyme with NAD(P)H-hydrate epimerase domain
MTRGQRLSGGELIDSFPVGKKKTDEQITDKKKTGELKTGRTFADQLFVTEHIRTFDFVSQSRGVPGEILMEAAAQGVYRWFVTQYVRTVPSKSNEQSVMILCGPGNNGADGLALARVFACDSWNTHILICNDSNKGLWNFQKRILNELNIPTNMFDFDLAMKLLPYCSWVFDCLLGTGQRLPLKDQLLGPAIFLSQLSEMNQNDLDYVKPTIIALDTPTGDYRTDVTLCLGAWNLELYQPNKRRNCGSIHRISLPFIPPELHDSEHLTKENKGPIGTFIDYDSVLTSFPQPDPHTYKNLRGAVGVIGGSTKYPGAPLLTLGGAAKSGAGLLYLNHRDPTIFSQFPGYIPLSLTDPMPDSLVIGPGWNLGNGESDNSEFYSYEQQLIQWCSNSNLESTSLESIYPFRILDAGALRVLARSHKVQKKIKTLTLGHGQSIILTPHYGEMKDLLFHFFLEVQTESTEIERIQTFTRALGVWLVVKYDTTLVIDPTGRIEVLDNPCAILGFGGSGDILAGIIASQLAKLSHGEDLWHGLRRAVVLHNYVGTRCEKEKGFVTAQEYLEFLGHTQAHGLG